MATFREEAFDREGLHVLVNVGKSNSGRFFVESVAFENPPGATKETHRDIGLGDFGEQEEAFDAALEWVGENLPSWFTR